MKKTKIRRPSVTLPRLFSVTICLVGLGVAVLADAAEGATSPRAIHAEDPTPTTPAATVTTPDTPVVAEAPKPPPAAAPADNKKVECGPGQNVVALGNGSWTCSTKSSKEVLEEKALAAACGEPGTPNLNEKMKSAACKAILADKELDPCVAKEKEAIEAYRKFGDACADAGLADVRTCMDEAKACVKSLQEDETTNTDNDAANDMLRNLGLASQTSRSQAARIKKCSVYSLKDYETEKRDRQRAYSDAQEKMSKLQTELAKEQDEFARKKKELQEDFVKAQAESRKLMTETQKKEAEEGQAVQKQLMEIDQQKAEFRVANLKARSEAAKITGERAMALAEHSDAMINTKCDEEVDVLIKNLRRPKLSGGGLSGASSWKTYRQSRINAVYNLCKTKLRAIRTSLIKDYRARLDVIDDNVRENANRVEALENQKTQLSQNNALALQRSQTSQQQSNQELYQKMQAMQTQLQEMTVSAQRKEMAANQNIQAAQQRVNEAQTDIVNLGKRPKGQKQPTEAAAQFRTFSTIVKTMKDSETCAPEAERLDKMIKQADLEEYHKFGLNGDPDKDEDESDSPDENDADAKKRNGTK